MLSPDQVKFNQNNLLDKFEDEEKEVRPSHMANKRSNSNNLTLGTQNSINQSRK